MGRYAQGTEVSPESSRSEIERILQRYGADAFMYGWEDGRAIVQFRAEDRYVRFVIEMPERDDPEYLRTPTGRSRQAGSDAAIKEWEQDIRQRWRALALVIKAKLEAVDSDIATFEEEFMANIVLPDGSTVGQFMRPQIEQAYTDRTMPAMLPALGAGD